MELALACDLRVVAATATLGLTEVRWGLIPGAGGTQRLPRSIPLAMALQLILSGDPIDAHEAYRLGLVNKVVEPADLMDESHRLADLLLSRGPLALQAAKRAVYEGLGQPLERGMALELELFNEVLDTEDAKEGPRAFAERRAPVYKGQ
jgi:E-phenylitaconyl-CoA hydratase